MHTIEILDSHTGGEPTRLVLEGFPDLGSGSMASRRARLATEFDQYRQSVILEPRGSDVLVGALLCQPVDPTATAGVIFFNNSGYLNMCGHGTIGLVASLAYLGRIQPGIHRIETPVGVVDAVLHEDGRVSVHNVPSYLYRQAVSIDVPEYGAVVGDIAWGGNWFFLVSNSAVVVDFNNIEALTHYAGAIRKTLEREQISGHAGGEIDHIELFGADLNADSRNFVLCPGMAYDRSPCGTGTSAKLACLAAKGLLQPGEIWHQASIIGSVFEGQYESCSQLGPDGISCILPTITGRAHVSARTSLILDDDDPFQWGITA